MLKTHNGFKRLHSVYIILFVIFLVFTQAENLFSLPKGVHQWAQADRYAIAERFMDDYDFFEPATYSLISDDGKVGVEFPLVQYISAGIALIFNAKESLPLIYRLLTFFLLTYGLWRLVSAFYPQRVALAALLFTFLLSSPILLFYGYNFLPDAAALGLVLWALSYFRKRQREVLTVILLTVAALLKTSSGIFLIAFAAQKVYHQLISRQFNILLVKRIGFYGLAILLVVAYDYYLVIQRNTALWSTLFLAQSNPIGNWSELKAVLEGMWRWKFEYLNAIQWIAILLAMLLSVWNSLRGKRSLDLNLWWCLGLLSIFYLFGKQFINHDYYFLATFMPVGLYGFLAALPDRPRLNNWQLYPIVAMMTILSFSLGSNQHFDRSSETCVIHDMAFENRYHWLLELRQEQREELAAGGPLFAVYEMEPNLVLCYLDKTGIVFNTEEMGRQESNFYYWLDRRQPQYVLCRAEHLPLFRSQHQAFLKRTTVLTTNETFSIFEVHGY